MRAWCLCEVLEKLYKIGCGYEKDVQDYEEISLCEATRGVSYRYVLAVKIPFDRHQKHREVSFAIG